ncbi:DUF2911 domain-containing protein [Flavobacterium sp.]|uniref:DUF2911 domain-containing protein n=1 Tax=Flavobacterium sp. TaxID=239 RepID=UPI0039E3FC74
MNWKSRISLCLLTFIVTFATHAQGKKASPTETAKGTINGADITINYGSPSVRGRVIWGELVPFGQVWRAGANEATTFETSKDITVAGQKLPAGKYSFFIIPEKDNATIIFNKDAKQWGAYDYSEKKDQLRVKVNPQAKTDSTEKMLFIVNPADVTLSWEKWNIVIPIK